MSEELTREELIICINSLKKHMSYMLNEAQNRPHIKNMLSYDLELNDTGNAIVKLETRQQGGSANHNPIIEELEVLKCTYEQIRENYNNDHYCKPQPTYVTKSNNQKRKLLARVIEDLTNLINKHKEGGK